MHLGLTHVFKGFNIPLGLGFHFGMKSGLLWCLLASIKCDLHMKLFSEGVESKYVERYFLSVDPQLMYRDICLSLLPHRIHCFVIFSCDEASLELWTVVLLPEAGGDPLDNCKFIFCNIKGTKIIVL